MSKDLQIQRVEIEVSYPLTDAMVEHRGVRIAELLRVKAEMEVAERARAKCEKKKIDDLEEQVEKLAAEIRTKSFLTMVEAEKRPIFETNSWRTVRIDSDGYGIVVGEDEPMSAEERQLAIDVDAEPEPREPPKQVKVTRKKKDPPAEAPVEDAAPPTH